MTKNNKTRKLFSIVILILFILIGFYFAYTYSNYFAIATTKILSLKEISNYEGWGNVTVESITNKDGFFISTKTLDKNLNIRFNKPEECLGSISKIGGVISGDFSDEKLGLQISINNSANLLFYKGQLKEGEYLFELLNKDDGSSWQCEDLDDINVNILSITNDLPRIENISLEWEIDSISLYYQTTQEANQIKAEKFYWDTLAENNNLTPENYENLSLDLGSQAVLSYIIKNNSDSIDNNSSYSLQYSSIKENEDCLIEEIEWNNFSEKSELSIWNISNDYKVSSFLECNENCDEMNDSENDFLKYYPIGPQEYQQLNFPIDTRFSKSGANYCIRLVTLNEDTGTYLNFESTIYPKISIKETDFVDKTNLKKENKIDFIDKRISFNAQENPKFSIDIFDPSTIDYSQLITNKRVLKINDSTITAIILDKNGNEITTKTDLLLLPNGTLTITLDNIKNFKPGKYKLVVNIDSEEGNQILETEFDWGVLALNTNKDIYKGGENVDVLMTVLDDSGRTICDAVVNAKVTSPNGGISYFTTSNGTISKSNECGPDNFTYKPDFSFSYISTSIIGEYKIKMTTIIEGKERNIEQSFFVEENPKFTIERFAPTRIYPVRDYQVGLKIYSEEGFNGNISEYVPSSFIISQHNGEIIERNTYTEIKWKVTIPEKGFIELGYIFDAPDISPEFYTLGPLSIGKSVEKRVWQIASDAVTSNYAVTCTGWTTPANAQGSPSLTSTAVFQVLQLQIQHIIR